MKKVNPCYNTKSPYKDKQRYNQRLQQENLQKSQIQQTQIQKSPRVVPKRIYIYIYIYIWLSPLRGWGSLTMAMTGEFVYIWLTISSCYGSIPLTLGLIGRDGGLGTLVSWLRVCLSAEGAKTFPGPGYLCLFWKDLFRKIR